MSRSQFAAIVLTLVALALDAPAQTPAGRQYALLVGVKNYEGTGLGDLLFTENDASDLAAVLRGAGYRRVVLMTEAEAFAKKDRGLFPKAENIQTRLRSLLEEARAGDTVVLGFSGHGVQIKGRDDLYFCPEESNLAEPKTLVSLTWVQDELKKCPAAVRLLIADACREVVAVPGKPKSALVDGLASNTRPEMPEPPLPPEGVVALYSCSTGRKSFESPTHKRGFLFHHVIEGLKGAASNAEGEVTLARLVSYAMDEVPAAVKDEFPTKGQRPQMLGEIAGKVTLVRGVKSPSSRVNAPAPKATAGGATLTVDLGGGVTMEFARIPKGDFLRGTPDGEADAQDREKPQKRVTISKDFYLGKYAVTQEQYKALTGDSPSWFSATGGGKDKVAGLDTARFPVERVSYHEALTFCALLKSKTGRNATLPTEAQWEYACRAGTTTPYCFGTKLNGDKANCDGTHPYGTATKGKYLQRTCKVGSYDGNAFGLYDMHGNVWQWCLDWYDEDYYKASPLTDPFCATAVDKEPVLRGGSWTNHATRCRAGCRFRYGAATHNSGVGFRVAFRLD